MSESAKNNMLRISKFYVKSWCELNLIELIITLRFHKSVSMTHTFIS